MADICLTTQSKVKLEAVSTIFDSTYTIIELKPTTKAELPEQPVNSGMECCEKRIEYIRDTSNYELIISIENGLETQGDNVDYIKDVCYVIIEDKKGRQFRAVSKGTCIPKEFYQRAVELTPKDYKFKHLGLSVTSGETIKEKYPDIDPKNWMGSNLFGCQMDRKDQIRGPLIECLTKYLSSKILYFKDFPKPLVLFKDLSAILCNQFDLRLLIDLSCDRIKRKFGKIDQIIGFDARGFIYGPLLAYKLRCGFVMARKKGKLPGKTQSMSYGTEYDDDGSKIIEIMDDPETNKDIITGVIKKGDRVLLCDDLIATGGTLGAGVKIVEKCGGKVVGCFVNLHVPFYWEDAKKKLGGVPIEVLIE